MPEENPLITDRKNKIKNWNEKGFGGYAHKFERSHTAREAQEFCHKNEGKLKDPKAIWESKKESFQMCGRIMNLREMGKLAFLKIRDVSGDFQICLSLNALEGDYKWFIKNLDLGDFAGFSGDFFVTKHGEPTLMAFSVTPLSKTLRPMPEKWKGLVDTESCYRERNLDLMSNPNTFDRFKKRSELIQVIRHFFHEKDFVEIETPILQSQAGGAMAKVFETHHNALDHDFVLRIALELEHKKVISGGFERVFEIGRNFRNEGSDPSHLQEFTMIEWYAAYEDLNTNKIWMEDLLKQICDKVFGTYIFDILDKDETPVSVDFSGKFETVTFAELLKKYAKIDLFKISLEDLKQKARDLGIEALEGRSRGNLLDDIYKKTARPHIMQPTFITDWPEDLKPLARPNGDGTSDVYQLIIAGWEVINAYGELVDPQIQRQLLEDQQKAKNEGDDEAMNLDETFLKAMEHGFPPMTGVGIGIDRLMTLLSGQSNLRDVVLFPTMKPERKPISAKEAEARYRSKKLVMIADGSLPIGMTANAMGQLGISIGMFEKEKMYETKFLPDADGRDHYVDSLYPMTNLSGSQKDMAQFAKKCYAADIQFFDFSDIMRKAHTDKQMLESYKAKKTSEIGYIAVGALVPSDFEKEFLSGLKLFGA